MMIVALDAPDFRTISEFRNHHLQALARLFVQVLKLAEAAGLMHLFCRPGELRHMEWAEIDTGKQLWSIPAAKIKMRQPHNVPLSRQALALLEELRVLTGEGRYCFPSIRTRARPMSETTMNAALRRLGYARDEVCPHGFRSTASTLLNESGLFNPDAIEAQLAHRPRGAGCAPPTCAGSSSRSGSQ